MPNPPICNIKAIPFYSQWKGHPIEDLETFRTHVTVTNPSKPIVYLAGDSSLDNKAWVPSSGPGGDPLPVDPPGFYRELFDSPEAKPDVAFWLNCLLKDSAVCLNCAVEESLLRERDSALLAHDEFIRGHIRRQDVLIVSVGANDVALRPTLGTILNMLILAWLTPGFLIKCGWAPPLLYFRSLFREKIQDYVQRLVQKEKPRAVVVCMIYFPLEAGKEQSGWADWSLKALGYDLWPNRLQAAIRKLYDMATRRVRVSGVEVIPCALYEVLDGKLAEDYVVRAEPSTEGGKKIGLFLEKILRQILDR